MHRPSRRSSTHPLVLASGLAFMAAVVVFAGFLIGAATLGGFFKQHTTEVPTSVSLASIRDVATFEAATGRFTTLVDQTDTTDHVPEWLMGEHVALSAEGDVDAVVDLSQVGDDDIEIADDGRVTIHVPQPQLTDPQLDLDATTVVGRERGIIDRLGDAVTDGSPTDDTEVQQRAVEKLRVAAAQSDLLDRARTNTEAHLEGLLEASGVSDVTVVFDGAGPHAA